MADTNADVIDRDGGLGRDPRAENLLHHYRTVDSVTIPKEYFEKVLPNERAPRAVLRTVFDNPFPLPLMGFLMASTPLGCTLMGWRGAGGQGTALVGVFYFFRGMLQIIGSVMEWIIGNTFPCVAFGSYGAFWLSLGATLTPFYNASGGYYNSSETGKVLAMGQAEYYNTYDRLTDFNQAVSFMIMTVLTFLYVLASFRTNITLVITFSFIDMAFFMLMSSYWTAAEGRHSIAQGLQIAARTFVFTFCMSGWYLWFSLILSSLDFPFELPLGELSKRIPSMTDREARKAERHADHGDKKESNGTNGTADV